jgi:hypothetical protein
MTFSARFYRHFRWLNLPGALLVTLLQRTPVLRVVASADEMVAASPLGAVLRSAFMGVASLGAMHSLAGATTMVTNNNNQYKSPLSVTVGTAVPVIVFGTDGTQTQPLSWRIGGSIPGGLSFSGRTTPGLVNVSSFAPLQLAGTPTTAGSFNVTLQAYEGSNGSLTSSPIYVYVINVAGPSTPPTITTQPTAQAADFFGTATLAVAASGAQSFQWLQNGGTVPGATSATLSIPNFQPAHSGLYTVVATNSAGSVTSQPVPVGILTTSKVVGFGAEIGSDITHPNGNIFDQILAQGAALSFRADSDLHQAVRMSFIDLNDDITQIEFSGPGTVSVLFGAASGAAAPVNYNQPDVSYIKGHAGIVVVGANETTNLSVFTVGRATAFDRTGGYNILLPPNSTTNNPANNGSPLFAGHETTTYDGVADIAFVAIQSTNGKFGGLRTANATYWATEGITGVYAPGVEFTGPVFVGDINAKTSAAPYLQIGQADVEVRITGGDLSQENGAAVQLAGISQIHFKDGSKSTGALIPAQSNAGVLMQNGVDVSAQVALPPGQ